MNRSINYAILERLVREEVEKAVANTDTEAPVADTKSEKKKKIDKQPTNYDALIAKVVGNSDGTVPVPQGDYELGKDVSKLDADDVKTFSKLYKVKPSKGSGEDTGIGSQGSGYGEVALAWLLSKAYPGKIIDTRGSSNPDLEINGVGVEVKSIDKDRFAIGRMGSDKESINLLNAVFAIDILTGVLEVMKKGKTGKGKVKANTFRFNGPELEKAFKAFNVFNKHSELRELGSQYDLIAEIYKKIDMVNEKLELTPTTTEKEAATALLAKLIKTKLGIKPGNGGYIANIHPTGQIEYLPVNIDSILKKDILTLANVNQGSLLVTKSLFK